ncbi:hypothetical protein EYF80_011477 [Liparis tanakae]|uniref:Uncharacterized protein n=1 Tax=Liparis tanakae TaxID=230148 RepID=A0A4Z2IKB9_9TELE|nr:hypothetical protein EYF80_011477 [Liparis tanakae]
MAPSPASDVQDLLRDLSSILLDDSRNSHLTLTFREVDPFLQCGNAGVMVRATPGRSDMSITALAFVSVVTLDSVPVNISNTLPPLLSCHTGAVFRSSWEVQESVGLSW